MFSTTWWNICFYNNSDIIYFFNIVGDYSIKGHNHFIFYDNSCKYLFYDNYIYNYPLCPTILSESSFSYWLDFVFSLKEKDKLIHYSFTELFKNMSASFWDFGVFRLLMGFMSNAHILWHRDLIWWPIKIRIFGYDLVWWGMWLTGANLIIEYRAALANIVDPFLKADLMEVGEMRILYFFLALIKINFITDNYSFSFFDKCLSYTWSVIDYIRGGDELIPHLTTKVNVNTLYKNELYIDSYIEKDYFYMMNGWSNMMKRISDDPLLKPPVPIKIVEPDDFMDYYYYDDEPLRVSDRSVYRYRRYTRRYVRNWIRIEKFKLFRDEVFAYYRNIYNKIYYFFYHLQWRFLKKTLANIFFYMPKHVFMKIYGWILPPVEIVVKIKDFHENYGEFLMRYPMHFLPEWGSYPAIVIGKTVYSDLISYTYKIDMINHLSYKDISNISNYNILLYDLIRYIKGIFYDYYDSNNHSEIYILLTNNIYFVKIIKYIKCIYFIFIFCINKIYIITIYSKYFKFMQIIYDIFLLWCMYILLLYIYSRIYIRIIRIIRFINLKFIILYDNNWFLSNGIHNIALNTGLEQAKVFSFMNTYRRKNNVYELLELGNKGAAWIYNFTYFRNFILFIFYKSYYSFVCRIYAFIYAFIFYYIINIIKSLLYKFLDIIYFVTFFIYAKNYILYLFKLNYNYISSLNYIIQFHNYVFFYAFVPWHLDILRLIYGYKGKEYPFLYLRSIDYLPLKYPAYVINIINMFYPENFNNDNKIIKVKYVFNYFYFIICYFIIFILKFFKFNSYYINKTLILIINVLLKRKQINYIIKLFILIISIFFIKIYIIIILLSLFLIYLSKHTNFINKILLQYLFDNLFIFFGSFLFYFFKLIYLICFIIIRLLIILIMHIKWFLLFFIIYSLGFVVFKDIIFFTFYDFFYFFYFWNFIDYFWFDKIYPFLLITSLDDTSTLLHLTENNFFQVYTDFTVKHFYVISKSRILAYIGNSLLIYEDTFTDIIEFEDFWVFVSKIRIYYFFIKKYIPLYIYYKIDSFFFFCKISLFMGYKKLFLMDYNFLWYFELMFNLFYDHFFTLIIFYINKFLYYRMPASILILFIDIFYIYIAPILLYIKYSKLNITYSFNYYLYFYYIYFIIRYILMWFSIFDAEFWILYKYSINYNIYIYNLIIIDIKESFFKSIEYITLLNGIMYLNKILDEIAYKYFIFFDLFHSYERICLEKVRTLIKRPHSIYVTYGGIRHLRSKLDVRYYTGYFRMLTMYRSRSTVFELIFKKNDYHCFNDPFLFYIIDRCYMWESNYQKKYLWSKMIYTNLVILMIHWYGGNKLDLFNNEYNNNYWWYKFRQNGIEKWMNSSDTLMALNYYASKLEKNDSINENDKQENLWYEELKELSANIFRCFVFYEDKIRDSFINGLIDYKMRPIYYFHDIRFCFRKWREELYIILENVIDNDILFNYYKKEYLRLSEKKNVRVAFDFNQYVLDKIYSDYEKLILADEKLMIFLTRGYNRSMFLKKIYLQEDESHYNDEDNITTFDDKLGVKMFNYILEIFKNLDNNLKGPSWLLHKDKGSFVFVEGPDNDFITVQYENICYYEFSFYMLLVLPMLIFIIWVKLEYGFIIKFWRYRLTQDYIIIAKIYLINNNRFYSYFSSLFGMGSFSHTMPVMFNYDNPSYPFIKRVKKWSYHSKIDPLRLYDLALKNVYLKYEHVIIHTINNNILCIKEYFFFNCLTFGSWKLKIICFIKLILITLLLIIYFLNNYLFYRNIKKNRKIDIKTSVHIYKIKWKNYLYKWF